jgi:plasmid stabilization system protein ParE
VIRLRISEAAAHSIIEQADFYRQSLDDALAAKWETAIDEAVDSLLRFPERGAPCRFRLSALAGLRWVFVPGFPKHMVFYRFDSEGTSLLIVQILHGARNLETILNEET